jgi:hypothetical protein
MANHCYNFCLIQGTKENLDALEQALAKAKESETFLHYETFHQVLGSDVSETPDSYIEFGTRSFDIDWQRDSDTTARLSGDSAWSPPCEFMRLVSKKFNLSIFMDYEESGNDFGGFYECKNGDVFRDDCMTYWEFRYHSDNDYCLESTIEEIYSEVWESLDELVSHQRKFWSIITEDERNRIITAFEEVQANN